jgi:hypothetical protein
MPRILVIDPDPNRLSQIACILLRCDFSDFYPAQDCEEALYAIDSASIPFDLLIFSEHLGVDAYLRLYSLIPWLKRINEMILLVAVGGEPEVVRFYNVINEQGGEVIGFIRDCRQLDDLGVMVLRRYAA